MDFNVVTELENKVAEFFGSPYAIAVDSCTHGIELCLRYTKEKRITVPKRTYLSVPFLAEKMGLERVWRDEDWVDYYTVNFGEKKIIDAAVLWKRNSYVPNSFMCLSFQYQKHLNIGRGGMILCDNKEDAEMLKKMSYDGRLPNIPWRSQNIDTVGYHYYMTPESAQIGLNKLENAINTKPRQWVVNDWPDLTEMEVFKNKLVKNN